MLVNVLGAVVPLGTTPRTYTVPEPPPVMVPSENECERDAPVSVEQVFHVLLLVEYWQLVKLLGSAPTSVALVAEALPVLAYFNV